MKTSSTACSFLAVLALVACGDDGPGPPTSGSTTNANQIPAGTVVSVVSGETGDPVPNAEMVIAGRTYRADAGGRLSLPEAVARGSLLDVLDPGFLDRQTLLRDPSSLRFPLWPRTSATGLNPDFTLQVVYADSSGNPQGMIRIRPGTAEAFIVPSAPIRNDAVAMQVIEDAADMLTEVTEGEIVFQVADSAPSGAVSFELVIDPGDPALLNAVAVAKRRVANSIISGGTVVYVTMATVKTSTTAHELGHMFGLQHSSGPDDIMSSERDRRRGTRRFSARETLAMRMMLQRLPGNRFPDNDRSATASGLRHDDSWLSVVVCER